MINTHEMFIVGSLERSSGSLLPEDNRTAIVIALDAAAELLIIVPVINSMTLLVQLYLT